MKKANILAVLLFIAAFGVFVFFWYRKNNPARQWAISDALATKLAAEKGNIGTWESPGDEAEWGDLAAWMRQELTDYKDGDPLAQTYYDEHIGQVLGFFKGVDVDPTGWNLYLFTEDVQAYIAAGGPHVDNVTQGQFIL